MSESKTKLRAFFAIIPTPVVQQCIIDAHQKLQQHLKHLPIRWHPASKLHITVRFCADLPREILPQLQQQLMIALKDIPRFQVSLDAPSLFPSLAHPIAIVHEARPIPALLRLEKITDAIMVDFGIAPEARAHRPHLTLAKTRNVRLHHLPKVASLSIPKFWVNQLTLLDSTPKNGEINYTPICSIPLKTR